MFSSLVAPLSILSLVSCVYGYKYDADSISTASLAVTCFYALVFIIISVLCILALGIARGYRLPLLTILVALVFSVIGTCAMIVYDVILSNGQGGSLVPGKAIVAMLALVELFDHWSLSFLFFSFCLLLKDRSKAIVRSLEGRTTSLSPVWAVAFFVVFVLLVIFGTAAAGLYINYASSIYLNLDRGVSLGEISRKALLYDDIIYTFDAIWYASAILVGSLAFHAYKTMHRTGVNDKVTKTLLYVAFPLYVCHVIQSIVFTILFSPSGLKLTFLKRNEIEGASLASLILEKGFYAATASTLVICGLRRSNWIVGGRSAASQKW